MIHLLPELPYAKDALAPHISAETIDFHYGKHHKTYVDNLNKFLVGNPLAEETSLEAVVRKAPQGPLFNNAAQVWNHTFYWNSLQPRGGGEPTGELTQAVAKSFGSFAKFQEEFTAKAIGHFGSGWAWLVARDGKLVVETTANAGTPLVAGGTPLLTCDVWEHAYYVDYRNARAKYVESWWKLVNWKFAAKNLETAKSSAR